MSHWSLVEKNIAFNNFCRNGLVVPAYPQPVNDSVMAEISDPPHKEPKYILGCLFGVVLICQERCLGVSKWHLYMSELIGGFLEISIFDFDNFPHLFSLSEIY